MLTNIPYWSISFQQPSKLKQSVKVVIKDEKQLRSKVLKECFREELFQKKKNLKRILFRLYVQYDLKYWS